jgi:hypothetical protein
MQLTPNGAQAAQLGDPEANDLLQRLLAGEDITQYTNAVCYDTVAFCSYLGRRFGISPDDLLSRNGGDWLGAFNFDGGTQWTGGNIDAGSAVGFKRADGYFHAAVGLGGTQVRGVNGFLLSPGWSEVVDLTTVLKDPDDDGAYAYDGTKIKVFVV